MIIWYVPGAGASERSFAWLRQQLPTHDARFFNYDAAAGIKALITQCKTQIEGDDDITLIGHSLGGVVATACSELPNVSKLVTICSPFGGIRFADMLSLLSLDPLIHDLRAYSSVLRTIRDMPVAVPHLSIIGTRGLPFIGEANDGVITVASQSAVNGPHHAFSLNHFEVLLSEDVARLVADFLAK